MQQVAVRGVQLDQVEARVERAACGRGEGGDDGGQFVRGERARGAVALEGQVACRHVCQPRPGSTSSGASSGMLPFWSNPHSG